MKEKKVMKIASRGKRFGAFCIDTAAPVVAMVIFFSAMIALIVTQFMFNPGFGYGNPGFGYGYGYGYNSVPSAGTVTAMIVSMIICIVWLIIQLVFFNKSQTIGKAALGLQVISSNDGEPVGFWKMLFREWFVKAASGSVFALGFIWILIDDKNRGWHDKILDTYVVDLKESAAINAASAARTAPSPAPRMTPAAAQAPSPKSAPLPVQEPAPAPDPVTVEEYIEVTDNRAAVMNDVLEAGETVAAAAQDAVSKAAQDAVSKAAQEEESSAEETVIELPGTVVSPEEPVITEEDEEQ